MRIATFFLTVIILSACSSKAVQPACTYEATIDASLVRLKSENGIGRYEFRNNHNCSLFYFHWLTQGPEPVAYCRSGTDEPWVCSTKVYGLEDEDGGFHMLTHETVLPPNRAAGFDADESHAEAVGVRLWSPTVGEEFYIWWEFE